MISQMIEEDKQHKEQLSELKVMEIKMLEQKVFERFDSEAAVNNINLIKYLHRPGKRWRRGCKH